MKTASNKICVTEKGMQFLNEQKQQLVKSNKQIINQPRQNSDNLTRTSSLPSLKTQRLLKQPGVVNKLSSMSKSKSKLEKIGLKTLKQRNQDIELTKILNQQFQKHNPYIKTIVPHLVKITKQKNKNIEFQSRIQRARAYVSKLQHQYQHKFVFRPPHKIQQNQ